VALSSPEAEYSQAYFVMMAVILIAMNNFKFKDVDNARTNSLLILNSSSSSIIVLCPSRILSARILSATKYEAVEANWWDPSPEGHSTRK
jgi:hypothetical protein